MIDFGINENHQMIRDMVREFAAKEVAPGAMERDENGTFPMDLVKKLGELGMMGVTVPEKFGGASLDVTSLVTVIEELARHDGSLALTLASHIGLCCGHINLAASDALKEKYLHLLLPCRHLLSLRSQTQQAYVFLNLKLH